MGGLAALTGVLPLSGCHTACFSGLEQQRQTALVQQWADANVVAVQGDGSSGSAFRHGDWLLTASHVVPDEGELRTQAEDHPLLKIVRGSPMDATVEGRANPADWAVLRARGDGLSTSIGLASPQVREGECVFVTGIRVVRLSAGLGMSFGPTVWPARVAQVRPDGVLVVQLDGYEPQPAAKTGGTAELTHAGGQPETAGDDEFVMTPVDELAPDKGVSGGAVVRVRGQRVEPIGINTHRVVWAVEGRDHYAIGAVSLTHVARSLAGSEPGAAAGVRTTRGAASSPTPRPAPR